MLITIPDSNETLPRRIGDHSAGAWDHRSFVNRGGACRRWKPIKHAFHSQLGKLGPTYRSIKGRKASRIWGLLSPIVGFGFSTIGCIEHLRWKIRNPRFWGTGKKEGKGLVPKGLSEI
jgi:hypothetical protein